MKLVEAGEQTHGLYECSAMNKGGTASLRHKIEVIVRPRFHDDSVRVVEAKTGESAVSLTL